ncbi:FecR family protein [Mucilaginibacter frigoritolerans]|uniref:FecR family protein n=1 Tax=Mucilaginibacter frigoritolerans TaxID=652788 RepID=A0A562TPU9_9SPHI|nr:FecR family protein [Mucilaginibacter frigoritolerans]TWI95599.1 FecR family protein [Mucilaginibacter frigoritolerans]
MNITEELIDKFFRQECTAEERSAVSDYFDEHPEELDKYFGEEDWKTFNTPAKLHPVISKIMLDAIDEHLDKDKSRKTVRFKVIGIAASIIVLLGITLFFGINRNKHTETLSLVTNTSSLLKNHNDTVYNKTDKAILVTLKDGSTVLLSGKSEIVYQLPFTQKNRDIYLKGEGLFKVAKDKNRPFTVYAEGLSTTALGTSFKITAFAYGNKVTVQLFSGKVVVKQQQNRAANADTYLTPGHTLILDKTSYVVSVISFDENESISKPLQSITSGATYVHGSIIKFQNQSLAEVFKILQKTYHIQIQADKVKLSNRTFTGDVDIRTDKPDNVLLTIATLNKLTLSKHGATYTLNQ